MKIKYLLFLTYFISTNLIIAQSVNYNSNLFQYLSPIPNSKLHLPQTNIIIRQGEALANVDVNDTTLISVNGSISGKHSGNIFLTDDAKTIIFEPDQPFTNGENVSVKLKYGINKFSGGFIDSLGFNFNITKGCTNSAFSEINKNSITIDSTFNLPQDFPSIIINNKNNPEDSYYFVGINQFNSNYISIFNNNGLPLYYKKIVGIVYDFKLQSNGLLTYFDGNSGKYFGLDSLLQVVDSFYTGNGYFTDFHELQVLPNGNYFVISYDPQPVKMDTVVVNGDTSACVIGCIIQELDKDKRVIWQWRSWDNYSITDADSIIDLTLSTIQYCHINSIDIPDTNNIILSAKHMNEITCVDRNTGIIKWRLGGKNNQFINNDPTQFKFQHDARYIGNNKLSLFDNGKLDRSSSRAVIYSIDTLSKSVSLIKEIKHIPDKWSKVMGNLQITNNGNLVIGWGNTGGSYNYITEYDSNGSLTNDVTLSNNNFIYSYRSFKFPWNQKILSSKNDSIKFQKLFNASDTTQTLKVYNNSSTSINITSSVNSNSDFTITDTFPITIPANSSANLSLKFTPSVQTKITDTLYVVSKTDKQMVALPIILVGNSDVITSVENETIPTKFKLYQNFPNPFNPSTIIKYSLPQKSKVLLKIYSILGEEIVTLIDEIQDKGIRELNWTTKNLASGIYIYRLHAISLDNNLHYSKSQKMLLLK